MKEARETFYDLLLGIALCSLIVCIAGAIFVDNKLTFIAGVIYGAIIAGGLAYHMFHFLEKTLDFDPVGAEKYARKMAIIRMGIMVIAAVAAIYLSFIFNIIGVLLGMMALKFAGYLQPIIRRYITIKLYNKGR
ncbi:MAG: hypothetical protein ACERKN_11040 [Velocimicrobium sp.]